MKDLKETYKTICNTYAHNFAMKHDLSFDGWVADDVGEVATMGDYCVDFRDIKYDIDNDIDKDEYVKYYDYCLEVYMLNLTAPNYESWCKGCPRIPQDVIDKIQGLRRELNELIKETKNTYNHGKINIAELLKNCPQGMELYSPIFGKVYLDKIRPHLGIVVTTDKEQGDFKEEFLYDGRYGMNGECMLFPSKDKTTWEGFVPPHPHKPHKYENGDIVITTLGNTAIIKEPVCNTEYYAHCVWVCGKLITDDTIGAIRFATESEKAELFQAIKKNGYKWNAENKALEKLTIEPKFKAGDKIVKKNDVYAPIRIAYVDNGFYYFNTENSVGMLPISDQDSYELVPNKFDISTLKPFDKVLVRHDRKNAWCGSLLSHMDDNSSSYCYKFVTIAGKSYPMCIPYEHNEHLLGTKNDCDEFYKTWE